MSLVIVHSTEGKIISVWRPLGIGKKASPILLDGQHLLEFADEPVELASLPSGEIGSSHVVDVSSGRVIRHGLPKTNSAGGR